MLAMPGSHPPARSPAAPLPPCPQRGVVAAGSVNHTLAVLHAAGAAAAARGIRVPARLFLPRSATAARADQLRQLGGQVEVAGGDDAEAEREARAAAEREGAAFIDALSDPQVSGGLGSIAIELLMQLPRGRLDAGEGGWLCPRGGLEAGQALTAQQEQRRACSSSCLCGLRARRRSHCGTRFGPATPVQCLCRWGAAAACWRASRRCSRRPIQGSRWWACTQR